jgi:ABC-type lipoprotein release transport system permease subunit
MLVEGYQQETHQKVAHWQGLIDESEAGVEEIKEGIRQVEAGMARVEEETKAQLAELSDTTRKVTLGLGFNLLIVHRDTNMADFWASDYAAVDMPEQYVDKLAGNHNLTMVTHIVATLQEKIEWERRKVLLVGYAPEATQSHLRKKAPKGYIVEPGSVFLGYELGVNHEIGDTIEIPIRGSDTSKQLKIARILPEQGSKDDISIITHLTDAQEILDKQGRVNQILALNCHCAEADRPKIRAQLEQALPEARVTEFRTKFLARAEQRDAVAASQAKVLGEMQANLEARQKILEARQKIVEERKTRSVEMAESREQLKDFLVTLSDVITPLVVLAAAIWVGLLALTNVRERRTEIGVLRALGKGTGTIVTLFLGKAVLLGLAGGLIGFGLGTVLGQALGESALGISADYFMPRPDIFFYTLIGAPLLAAVASYLPTLSAVIQDPAVVLREP